MDKLNDALKITGKVKCILHDTITGKDTITEYTNIVVTVGKVAIARRLANVAGVANEGIITYGATGTGTNTPTVADTTLQTEIARKLLSVRSNTNNIAVLRVFYNETESVGTLTEFGLFGEDASATANTGTMFNRLIIAVTKTITQTLTIECQITIN